MKRFSLLLIASALLFGCATPQENRSAGHVVIPANVKLGQTTWVPGEGDIRDLEAQVGFLFLNPDLRLTGLPELPPPYPLGDYLVRYTVAGPADQPYILGEAVHRNRPEAATHLDPTSPGFDPKQAKGPMYFTLLYDVKTSTIREIHFNMR
ncbi:MAG: hypothetical protein SFV32_08685 [Opitutaceae bacterium]|nr:hypothetical protein [Opitutaceae bacterium]